MTGIVDSDGIRDREAGVRGNQRIEVNQRAVTVDEADVFARPKRMIALNGKEGGTDNLSGAVDPSRRVSYSSGKRSQVSPAAVAMEARVRGRAVKKRLPTIILPVLLIAFAQELFAPAGTPSETIFPLEYRKAPTVVPLPTIWPASLIAEAEAWKPPPKSTIRPRVYKKT